jgi:hypothetical protein
MRSVLLTAVVLASLAQAGCASVAPPADILTDSELLAYAKKAIDEEPSLKGTGASVGIHHGLTVSAWVKACDGNISCALEPAVVFYRTSAKGAACRKAGGVALVYAYNIVAYSASVGRFCVPGILVSNNLAGVGRPEHGDRFVKDIY